MSAALKLFTPEELNFLIGEYNTALEAKQISMHEDEPHGLTFEEFLIEIFSILP